MQSTHSFPLQSDGPGAGVVHVPAGEDFAASLVAYVWRRWPRDRWAEAIIFLPNKRSIRQVREAFIGRLGDGTALLPSMVALGDIDPAALLLLHGVRSGQPPLPVMPVVQRRLLLAKQIGLFFRAQGQECSLRYTLEMADSLASLLDEAVRYGVDLKDVRHVVPGHFNAHWQQSLAFLAIVFQHWPRIEQGAGMVSHPQALVSALHEVAANWEAQPPSFPVMVAGSTGSQPATARLLVAVSKAPSGVVLFPSAAGVDAAYGAGIDAGHPLYHVAMLAKGIDGAEGHWPASVPPNANAAYAVEAFRPLGAGESKVLAMPETMLPIACADEWEEARVVGLIVREALLSSSARIMVVSPDRATLQRVSVTLLRWGIRADSSSASRLKEHPFVSWMLLLLAMIESGGAALDVLACFQHPLMFADSRSLHDEMVVALDTKYARGIMKRKGIAVVQRLVASVQDDAAIPFAAALENMAALHVSSASLDVWMEHIAACAHACGADAGMDDAARGLIDSLLAQSAEEVLSTEEMVLLLEHASDIPWFGRGNGAFHPQVFLHTPIEARLQTADHVVLAGLNEGVWPGIATDPWLNQAMRRQLRLPVKEHELSLQAHDFLMLASHARVYLTRPERMQQSITVPSRWWQRFMLVQKDEGLSAFHRDAAHKYTGWARRMDVSDIYAPALPPMPNPPVLARPRVLRATQMEDLLSNPYAVYARSVLGLEKFDDIDRDLDASLLGTLMHRVLERAASGDVWTDADLQALVDDALLQYGQSGKAQLLWRDRLLLGLRFFMEEHGKRAPLLRCVESEVDMQFAMPVQSETVHFRGRADRIERYRDGHSAIVDYKTGSSGLSRSKAREGQAPQLPLYHMADAQRSSADLLMGLGNVALAYWVMPHGPSEGEVLETPLLSQDDVRMVLERFQAITGHYLLQDHPMLYAPSMAEGRYDYSALARAAEWGGPDSADD